MSSQRRRAARWCSASPTRRSARTATAQTAAQTRGHLPHPQTCDAPLSSDRGSACIFSGVWNSSQAEALFAFSKSKGLTAASTLFGFELGEELTKFQVKNSPFPFHPFANLRQLFAVLTPNSCGQGWHGRVRRVHQELPRGGGAAPLDLR